MKPLSLVIFFFDSLVSQLRNKRNVMKMPEKRHDRRAGFPVT